MEIVREYYCWRESTTESEAKVIKTGSVNEAAKTAMDSWIHEGTVTSNFIDTLVNVKDENGKIHKVRLH